MSSLTECPHDGHALVLLTDSQRLTCSDRHCVCVECHRQLSEAEAKAWKPE
jgi:hypothetical protein